jgi:hypothetical protein
MSNIYELVSSRVENGITKEIAIIWGIKDVYCEADTIEILITEEQASDILDRLLHKHDAEWGICWETIRTLVEEYKMDEVNVELIRDILPNAENPLVLEMKVDDDFIFDYDEPHNFRAVCGIQVFKIDNSQKVMILATELKNNPGASITNAAENIATEIIRLVDIQYDNMIWIEHYKRENEEDTFDYVKFECNSNNVLSNPEWIGCNETIVGIIEKTIANIK